MKKHSEVFGDVHPSMFDKIDKKYGLIPKKKGKTIGNPPKVQQMPYNPRKENKN